MGLTYTVQDAWDEADKLIAGTPISDALKIQAADKVCSTMWTPYPWYRATTTIAAGSLSLVNQQQDYSAPVNIFRLLTAYLLHTSVTPNDARDIDVVQDQSVNLMYCSPYQIRSIAMQAGVGLLRLECAPQIDASDTWEIGGTYQVNPTKITSLGQDLWFDDQYFPVFSAGVLYYAYQYANQQDRAGSVTYNGNGQRVYSGQLAVFMAALRDMRQSEDLAGINGLIPDENLAPGRQDVILNIYGVA